VLTNISLIKSWRQEGHPTGIASSEEESALSVTKLGRFCKFSGGLAKSRDILNFRGYLAGLSLTMHIYNDASLYCKYNITGASLVVNSNIDFIINNN